MPPLRNIKTSDCGLVRIQSDHAARFVNPIKLKKEVDEFMRKFAEMEQQQPNPNPSKKKRKRMMTEADDEGWTTVVRTRGPMSGLQRDAPEEDAVRARKDDELRKGERNMGKQADFYTFQLSALKAKRIGRMAKKFLSNKNKIELMKAQRKFTPY